MREQRALVVDDHPIIRDGIKQLLVRAFPSLHIRDSQGTDGVLDEICSYPWAFVTLDINLPGQNGLHIIRETQGCCPTVPIIVFSLFSEDQYGPRALRAGAAAYVSKDRSPLELVEVVQSVLRGEKKGQSKPPARALSTRETEVLNLLGKGMNRQQIAHELGINEKTVSTYRARLLHKLDARTTVNLLRFASDEGLLSADQAPTGWGPS
jgi:DNA-binding NarL/FixJ family response regulator